MVDTNATRSAFSGMFERPPLTDQLLNRPPFKFLVDVLNATINQTGYLKDEFKSSELDASNLQDKSQKMGLLDKLIKLLDDGSLSDVKSAKIVAGKEPELTNLMLIKLAENARSYSNQAKENNAPVEKKKRSSSKEKKEKEHKSKDRDKDRDKEREKDRNGEKKDRSRSHEKSDSKSSSKDKDKKEHRSRSRDKDKKDRDKDREKRKSEKKSKDKESKHEVIEDQLPNNNHIDNQLDVDSVKSPSLPSPTVTDDKDEDDLPLPPPPEERERQLRLATAGGRPQTSMGRPGTAAARPAPPKIKKKHIATIEDTPQTNKEPEAEIIGEGAPATEETENFLVEEDQPIEDLKEMQAESALLDESERGALVQKIVSTKQELEEGTGEVEEEPDDDMTRNIEREKIIQLQSKVQEATRTAFPISRTIDYAQEDLESMMRELEKWRAEVRKNESAYQDKMANQKSEAFKLTTLLSRLDDEIREVKHQLTTTKKRIADLEERITIMIANI